LAPTQTLQAEFKLQYHQKNSPFSTEPGSLGVLSRLKSTVCLQQGCLLQVCILDVC
jgi:hypothetical protein